MNVDAGLLDLAYVGVMLGTLVLLALFWHLLPRLLREEITKAGVLTDARLRPARGSNAHFGRVLPQP